MNAIVAVALGGAVGAIARHLLVEVAVQRFLWRPFAATMVVNVVGCLCIGLLFGALERGRDAGWDARLWEDGRLLIGVGVLGSFTTFSTFGHETLALLRSGAMGLAGANVLGQVVLGLCAVALGRWLAA